MDYFYVYNIQQARFFIKNGLVPTDVGIGTKREVFIKFVRNQEAEDVFTKWVNRNK